jgi:hypothetical protein
MKPGNQTVKELLEFTGQEIMKEAKGKGRIWETRRHPVKQAVLHNIIVVCSFSSR